VRTNEGVWGVVEKKHEWIGEAAGGSSFFRRAKQWILWSMPLFLRMRGGTPLKIVLGLRSTDWARPS
jgi:hypothetical protein